ncbi:PREDICTED: DNA dC-_dU-editing enzyme APOBEC-3F-like [Chinchilla lanigera]|uniref:DNA dC->dU-editing enzyme APOBEC-3F-like n=1 Tax=Chinchilla lanigera TaxID=34839 RepID=UPI000696C123|nr:PREDICTED: DNA dC->dU-editing enzyme APOBEC-3F-like [Chinchilla lanigera]
MGTCGTAELCPFPGDNRGNEMSGSRGSECLLPRMGAEQMREDALPVLPAPPAGDLALLPLLSQVGPQRLHAELSFLSWFHDTQPSLDESYRVTWYVSWSPCDECAKEIAKFLANHHNVTLTIYAARIYYYWKPTYKEGLQALAEGGAQISIMSLPEFEECWNLFVCKKTFRPWKNFLECYLLQDKTLKEILSPAVSSRTTQPELPYH